MCQDVLVAADLAELRAAVDHAELSLRAGAPTRAMLQLDSIWPELVACGPPDLVWGARLTRALALEALGRLSEAIIELEECLADGSSERDQATNATIALSRCYRESGHLDRAIECGERHLATLSELGALESDAAVQLTVTVAAAHHERGDVGHAARMCRRAIESAERLDTTVAKASAYWNVSVIENARGAVDAAVGLAERALRLLEEADDNRNLARLRTFVGTLQLQLEPPLIDAARAHLEVARLELRWSAASRVDKCRNELAMAEAHLLAGELAEADGTARAVLHEASGSSPILIADALLVLGRVAARRGDAELAAQHYRRVVHELTGIGWDGQVAAAWFELGALLDDLGLEGDARDAYRRAGASTGLRAPRATGRANGGGAG